MLKSILTVNPRKMTKVCNSLPSREIHQFQYLLDVFMDYDSDFGTEVDGNQIVADVDPYAGYFLLPVIIA